MMGLEINSMRLWTSTMTRLLGPQPQIWVHLQKIALYDCAGRDFDYFGKTAKIANVMEEEQMTYARSHGPTQPPPTQAARQTEIQRQQQQTSYVQRHLRQQQQPHQAPMRTVSSLSKLSLMEETTCTESCSLG